MSLKVGEQTDVSRLKNVKQEVTRCGLEYDRAKKELADYKAVVRTLVQDATIEKRKRELVAAVDRCFHALQEKVQLVSFYQSAMRQKRPEDWKRR
jgi:hypothetical protein